MQITLGRQSVERHHAHSMTCTEFGKALEVGAVVIVDGKPSLTGAPEFAQGPAIAIPGGGAVHKVRFALLPFKHCPFCGKDLNPPIRLES
jgi:hypothetical protein